MRPHHYSFKRSRQFPKWIKAARSDAIEATAEGEEKNWISPRDFYLLPFNSGFYYVLCVHIIPLELELSERSRPILITTKFNFHFHKGRLFLLHLIQCSYSWANRVSDSVLCLCVGGSVCVCRRRTVLCRNRRIFRRASAKAARRRRQASVLGEYQ